MSRIDDNVHVFASQVSGQTLHPAEAAGAHSARDRRRATGSTGKRGDHVELRPGIEQPREAHCLTGASENENPLSQYPSDLPASSPWRSNTTTSICVLPSSIASARVRASRATLVARGKPEAPAICRT